MPTSERPRWSVSGTVKVVLRSAWTQELRFERFFAGVGVVGEFDADFVVEGFAGIEAEGVRGGIDGPAGRGLEADRAADRGVRRDW